MKIFNLQFIFAIAVVLFYVMGETTARVIRRSVDGLSEPGDRILAGRRAARSVDEAGERILAGRRGRSVDGADRILARRA